MCPSSHHIFGHSLAEDLEEGLLPKVGQVLGGQAVTGQLPALRVLYGGVSLGPANMVTMDCTSRMSYLEARLYLSSVQPPYLAAPLASPSLELL